MRAVVLGTICMAGALVAGFVARDLGIWRVPAPEADGRAGYLVVLGGPGDPALRPALAWPLDSFTRCERIAALLRDLDAAQAAAGSPAAGATFCIPFAPPHSSLEKGRRRDRP